MDLLIRRSFKCKNLSILYKKIEYQKYGITFLDLGYNKIRSNLNNKVDSSIDLNYLIAYARMLDVGFMV